MRAQDKVSWESVIHAKGPLRSFFFGINIILIIGGTGNETKEISYRIVSGLSFTRCQKDGRTSQEGIRQDL